MSRASTYLRARHARGLCRECGKARPAGGEWYCPACKAERRRWNKTSRQRHGLAYARARVRAQVARVAAGRCARARCGRRLAPTSERYCRGHVVRETASARAWRRAHPEEHLAALHRRKKKLLRRAEEQALCRRCFLHPIAERSRSRCEQCLAYARRVQHRYQ